MDPPEVDIQQLIEGDSAAWAKAHPYLQPAAFHIARKLLNHCCPQFVEDIVQGAIVQLSWRLPLIDRPIGNIHNVKALLADEDEKMARIRKATSAAQIREAMSGHSYSDKKE